MNRSVVIFFFAFWLTAACAPNQRIVNSSAEREQKAAPREQDPTPETALLETDVAAMRTADFNFIYVFRRRDGAVLDAEDRAFMSGNIPFEINRKILSDAGHALVIGSNFRIPPENFAALKERFSFQNFSKPESEVGPTNSNTSTN